MPGRFADWHRQRNGEGTDAAQTAMGKKVLGALMDDLALAGLPTGVKRYQDPDGTLYVASFDGVVPTIAIHPVAQEAPSIPTVSQLWTPRGFVIYPMWVDRPFGVGLPVIGADTDPYSTAHLTPGIDPTGWTPGGPCGEVLISPDEDAGYPPAAWAPSPLMYDETWGPRPLQISDDLRNDLCQAPQWAPYRLSLDAFSAWQDQNDTGFGRAVFEQVNAARTANAVPVAYLPFRGYSDIAFDAASVLVKFNGGSGQQNYPPGYGDTVTRMTKDGYPCDWIGIQAYTAAQFTRTFWPRGVEFAAMGADAAACVTNWNSISSGQLTGLDTGTATQLHVSSVGGYRTCYWTSLDRWIQAGNVAWKGSAAGLPPISWHGFASVNLAWETYPARFNDGNATTPLALLSGFAFLGSNNDPVMRYVRSNTHTSSYYDSVLGRHLYARGRAIALAPNGGLFWGACVQQYGETGDKIDRLIALVHHPEDQPADTLKQGYTRYLRVWWCDIPARDNGLRLAPAKVIAGTAAGAAWNWQGGAQVDMGVMAASADSSVVVTDPTRCSLKYAACWRFRLDGKRAACMRDYGSFEDYTDIANGGGWVIGRAPRTVELVFEIGAPDVNTGVRPLTTTPVYHDYSGIGQPASVAYPGRVPMLTNDVAPVDLYAGRANPIAVDYDGAGNLLFAYAGLIFSTTLLSYTTPGVPVAQQETVSRQLQYAYMGTGPEGLVRVTDIRAPVLQGCTFATGSVDRGLDPVVVLDVRSATFAMRVHRPRFALPSFGVTVAPGNDVAPVPDYPCQMFSAAQISGVVTARHGSIADEAWFACPDGAIWTTAEGCQPASNVSYTTDLPLAISGFVQGYYAERFGEVVYGYQVAPMPMMVWRLSSQPADGVCGCMPSGVDLGGGAVSSGDVLTPRGGRIFSTIALPNNDWSGFIKTV